MTPPGKAWQHVSLKRAADHVRLVLERPARANSLDAEMLEELAEALAVIAADPPHALVLAGAGRHFSTGGDVACFAREVAAGNGHAYAEHIVGTLHEAILTLLALPCPVIAELNGATTGGALGLALTADLVVMTSDAFLQPYYAVVGFGPDGGWTALLPERIGTARALSIQMLNRRIDAQEALALGLATEIAAHDAALATVTRAWLTTIASHVPGTLTATRRLVWDERRLQAVRARLDAERATFVERIEMDETRKGMTAFLASIHKPKRDAARPKGRKAL